MYYYHACRFPPPRPGTSRFRRLKQARKQTTTSKERRRREVKKKQKKKAGPYVMSHHGHFYFCQPSLSNHFAWCASCLCVYVAAACQALIPAVDCGCDSKLQLPVHWTQYILACFHIHAVYTHTQKDTTFAGHLNVTVTHTVTVTFIYVIYFYFILIFCVVPPLSPFLIML